MPQSNGNRLASRWGAMKRGFRGVLLVGTIALAGAWAPAVADVPAPALMVGQGEDDTATLRRSLDVAQAAYQQVLAAGVPPAGATPEEVLEHHHLMGEWVAGLQHTLEATERLPGARQRLAEQEAHTREWTAFPTPPPYSILLVDQLRESLDTATFKVQAATSRAALQEQEATEAEQRYKAAEITKRQSEESAARAEATGQRDRQLWLLDLARLHSRAAAASLQAARQQRAVAMAEAAEQRELGRLLEKQVTVARQTARFSQANLDAVLADLDRRRTVLEKQESSARAAGQRSRQALVLA